MTTEPEALAALEPILNAIAKSGKIDWHNIRRAICDGEATMRERAAQIADAELVDTFEDSPEVDGICNSVVREIAKSIRALSTPAARMVAGEGEADCERCQGNGEIVTNWDRYMHGHDGDKGDEAVAECPDCNGTGKVEAHPPAAEPVGLRDAVEGIDDDYMTSEKHHPGYVLIPTAKFEQIIAATERAKGIVPPHYVNWHHDADKALTTPARTDDAGEVDPELIDRVKYAVERPDAQGFLLAKASMTRHDFRRILAALSPAPDRGEV